MKPDNKILVGILEPDKGIVFCHIENTLEAFQKAVGGYIETFDYGEGLLIVMNEEGVLLDLPENDLGFRGTLVFCRTKGDEFASLKFFDVVVLKDLFSEVSA